MATKLIVLFALLACCLIFFLGLTHIIYAKGNYVRTAFGIFTSIVSILVLSLSFSYITLINDPDVSITPYLLDVDYLMLFLPGAIFLTSLPTISIHKLSFKVKTIILTTPILLCLIIFIIFKQVTITPLMTLHSLSGNINLILSNSNHPDVLIRFILLVLCGIIPIFQLFYPLMCNPEKMIRKPSKNYYIISALIIICIILFWGYSLRIPYTLIIFPPYFLSLLLVISLLLLKRYTLMTDAPLIRSHLKNDISSISETDSQKDKEVYLIWQRLEKIMELELTNPKINLQDIAFKLGVKKELLGSIIIFYGYVGFNEYVNMTRLKHFKELAAKNPKDKIVNLYEAAGFQSKSTFYNFFQSVEGITPTEYLIKLNKKE